MPQRIWERVGKSWELPQKKAVKLEQSPSRDPGTLVPLWPGPAGRDICLAGITWTQLGRLHVSNFFLLRDIKGIPWGGITIVLQSSLGRKDFNLLIISTQFFHLFTCSSFVGCLSEKCIRGKIMTCLSAVS